MDATSGEERSVLIFQYIRFRELKGGIYVKAAWAALASSMAHTL